MTRTTQISCERFHLRGAAHGVGVYYDDPPEPVDGVYDVSTISIDLDSGSRRTETVAFKRSGIGPSQISEPYHITTLTIGARVQPKPIKHWPWQHNYSKTVAVGEYDSITGPRTIIKATCECGKTCRYTVRGSA